jgi:hypothetical protein
MKKEDLQIVVIEDLKDFWHDPDVRQLYCDMMQVKFTGYGSVYGENVISTDKVDFFGTHLMVCKKGIRLKPLFGYKSVTYNKCVEYNTKFPALGLVSTDAEQECLEELNRILSTATECNKSISFDYSWAQDPSIKNIRSPEMAQFFRDLVMVMVVNHHKDYEIDEMITCGVVKVKTDLFFEKMGFSKISNRSLFSQKDLNGEKVHIFHTEKYSDYAYDVAEKHKDLWANRISLSSEESVKNLKIA